MKNGPEHEVWHQQDALSRRLGSSMVLLSPSGDQEPVTLNASGAALWRALAGPTNVDELVGVLGPEAAVLDVTGWLHDMAARGLVGSSPAGPVIHDRPRALDPALARPATRLTQLLDATPHHDALGSRLLRAALAEEGVIDGDHLGQDEHEALLGGLARMLLVERGALRAHEALQAEGIPTLFLKGLATAHLDHARPEVRSFGDADLLVPERQFTAALGALGRIGFRPTFALERSAATAKAVTLLGPHDVVIDLHQRLVRGTYGFLATSQRLLAPPERFTLGGVEVEALPRAARFVHAALHARLTTAAPHTWLDLAVLGQAVPDDHLEGQARSWRAMTICTQASDDMTAAIGFTPTPHWSSSPDQLDRWLAGGHYGVVRREVAALAVIGRPRAAARYATAKLAPGARYRADRGRSRWGHLRQGLSRPRTP